MALCRVLEKHKEKNAGCQILQFSSVTLSSFICFKFSNMSNTSVVADLSVCTRQTVKAAAGLSRTSGLSRARGTWSTAPRHRHLKTKKFFWIHVVLIYLLKHFNNSLCNTYMWAYIYLRLSVCPHNIVVFNQQVST